MEIFKRFMPKKNKNDNSKIKNSKKEKRENLRLSSKNKDILKSLFDLPVRPEWLSDEEIDKIQRDSTVTAAIGSRKASTLKKEIQITCKNKEMQEALENIFDHDTLDSILDIPYQGFGVFEVNWNEVDYILYPSLSERNYKSFELDKKILRYAANGIAEDIPEHKALYAVYKAKPLKPYGQPLYNPLFWLIEFKNASLEFWVELLEKFGTPWVIGKTEGNKDDFADEIYNMLGGDGAVLDPEDSLEITTVKEKGSYKEIIEYIDNQIREVILGGNLTGQVKGGSQAAATVHNDIREDLAQADQNILNKFIRDTIAYFKTINNISEEIKGILKDKDDPNKALADRDKVIYDMGYVPTKEYIENTYNIKVEQFTKSEDKNPVFQNSKMYFSKNLGFDEHDAKSQSIDTKVSLTFQREIINTIEKASSYEEAFENLAALYPNVKTKDLEDNLYKYIHNSSLLGIVEIEEENPNG